MRRQSVLSHLVAFVALVLLAVPALAVDTDQDGLTDEDETEIYGTDPELWDSDGDTLSDLAELTDFGTFPMVEDSDGDLQLDDVDSEPLHDPQNDYGGGTPTGTGFSESCGCATSCDATVQDGSGAYLAVGSYRTSITIGGARVPGGLEPAIVLFYDSHNRANGRTGNFASWLDTFVEEDQGGDVRLLGLDGKIEEWDLDDGDYVGPLGVLDTLEKVDGVFVRTSPDGTKVTYGSLDKIEDRHGNTLDIGYANGRPSTITDSRGEVHTLTYYSSGRLRYLEMADGAVWELQYNSVGQLLRVIGPATTSFPTGIRTEFRYMNGTADPDMNGNLISRSDGRGNWWLRNVYDTNDRLVRQYVNGGYHLDFDYSLASSEHKVTVTDRAGNERVWEWDATTLAKKSLLEKTNRSVRALEGDYLTTWTSDAEGYITAVTYPRGNGVKWTLNAAKLPTETRHKADMAEEDDDDVDLVETTTYDATKYWGVTSRTDAEGNETTYTLNSKGQPTEVTFPTVGSVTVTHEYAYDSATGEVTSFTDGEGSVTTYEYYDSGPRTGMLWRKVVDAGTGRLNLTTVWDYEDWGDVKSVTDPRGNTTTYTVERYGNVERIEAPSSLGYVTEFDHDGNLNVVTKRVKNIDWDGTWLTWPQWWTTWTTYGLNNRVSEVLETVAAGVSGDTLRTTMMYYTPNDELYGQVRGGRIVENVYDERGLVFTRNRVSPGVGTLTTTFAYDGNRNLTSVVNPRGKTTTQEYDLFDRRTRSVNALGDYQEFVYDKGGNVTERKFWDEAGATDVLLSHHRTSYDAMDRAWKEEDALLGATTTWVERTVEFDARSLVTTATDARGAETTFAYDGAGRLVTTSDELGNGATRELDENGNVTATEETEVVPGSQTPETFRTEMEYDVLNRLVERTEIDRTNSANTKVTQWKRSAIGLRRTIDPRENAVTFTLDGLGRVTTKSEDLGGSAAVVTAWEWANDDQVTKLTDDNGHETLYEYDGYGRLVTKTYESEATVSYQYDENGNLTVIEDQNGTVISQGFDDLDRLVGRDIDLGPGVGGDTEEAFAYDALGRLTAATDDDSTVQMTYDSLSRVLTEAQGGNPLGDEVKTVSYAWDAESGRTLLTYPSGFEAHEERDVLGRLTAIEDGNEATVAAFDLYGGGLREKKRTLANGTYAAVTYDGFRRPTEIAHKTSGNSQFAGFAYAWDKTDNPLMEARSHKSGTGDVYGYDAVNRLVRVLREVDDPAAELADPGSEVYVQKLEYEMDDVFNLTAFKLTPYQGQTSTTSYTTDAMNQYTAIGSQSLTYTDAGSLEDDGTRTYVYDAHQHLIEVWEGETQVAAYSYDALGLGRRTAKTVGAATTRYVYAGQQSIEEWDGLDEEATLSRLFVFGERIDQIVAMEAPDQADVDADENTSEVLRFSYHTQLIGSVTQVTGPAGSVVESYEYDPYGAPTIRDGGGNSIGASAIGNAYPFTARQLDEETGLYYYRARHYSPELRRFIQRDPLEYVDGPNASACVRNRATACSDPMGLRWQDVVIPDDWYRPIDYEAGADPSEARLNRYAKALESWKDPNASGYTDTKPAWDEIKATITVEVTERRTTREPFVHKDGHGPYKRWKCALNGPLYRSAATATVHWPGRLRSDIQYLNPTGLDAWGPSYDSIRNQMHVQFRGLVPTHETMHAQMADQAYQDMGVALKDEKVDGPISPEFGVQKDADEWAKAAARVRAESAVDLRRLLDWTGRDYAMHAAWFEYPANWGEPESASGWYPDIGIHWDLRR